MALDLDDYFALVREAPAELDDDCETHFARHLPWICRDAYVESAHRSEAILVFEHGSFTYVFDAYTTLEKGGTVECRPGNESRLVVAFGRSTPLPRKRDDRRLRRWIGPTSLSFGQQWDKGHFIAHSIGGAVDGIEANVFIQRRDLNRGWSDEGKRFRRMESYCAEHAGTFCFVRPIYRDGTARPRWLDFGLIDSQGVLDVYRFRNHYDPD